MSNINPVVSEVKSSRERSRCRACGTAGSFPSDWTPEQVSRTCEVCRFHSVHQIDTPYDITCPICLALQWQARLRALRILLFYRAWLREEL